MKLLTNFKYLTLVLVLFSACNNSNKTNTDAITDSSVILNPENAVIAKDNAIFQDEAGTTKDISNLKGKVHFINFWATWCPPCRAEMPSIQVLYDKFKDNPNMEFHLVEIEKDINGTKSFLAENNLNLPIVYPASDIPEAWLGGSIPTTIILDKEGNIAMRKEGMHDYSEAETIHFIQDLLNK